MALAAETWDVQVSQSWLNGVNPDYFYYLDSVLFNDAGAAGTTPATVNLFTGVSPGRDHFRQLLRDRVCSVRFRALFLVRVRSPLNGGGTVTLNTPQQLHRRHDR